MEDVLSLNSKVLHTYQHEQVEEDHFASKKCRKAEYVQRRVRFVNVLECTSFNMSRVILLYQFYCDLSNLTVYKFL